jgi:hydrogenase expression/formation protein HypE
MSGKFDRNSPPLGKFSRETIESIIYTQLGKNSRRILVGPKFGVDNTVISIGNGNVMVATCDPLSFIPELGARNSARISVDLLASDLTTSGLPAQYGIFDLNLPPEMTQVEFAEYWKAFGLECNRLGISIVGGHTGRYLGCGYTVIGGGVLFSIGMKDHYLTPEMANRGDDILLTKGAAIETTAVLTRVFPKSVRKFVGSELYERARRYLNKLSTVEDALIAVSVGFHEDGITAMHDATEGGVVSAILELAEASHKGAEIDLTNIRITEESAAVCQLFRIDPLTSLSEGSLLLTTNPSRTSKVLSRLEKAGIPSRVIGHITSKSSKVYASTASNRYRLRYPKFDPYWRAYAAAKRNGWH